MQYTHRTKASSLSPKRSRNEKLTFINDYFRSVESNIAPTTAAMDHKDWIEFKKHLSSTKGNSASNATVKEELTKFLHARTKPPIAEQQQEKEAAAFRFPAPQFLRRLRMEAQDDSTKSHGSHIAASEDEKRRRTPIRAGAPLEKKSDTKKKLSGAERRSLFGGLSEEALTDYGAMKTKAQKSNHRPRLRSDYISRKFSEMDMKASDHTIMTDASSTACMSLSESLASELLPPSEFQTSREEDDEHFVDGLIFLAPDKEKDIREMMHNSKTSRAKRNC
jgi:hypothetical protein